MVTAVALLTACVAASSAAFAAPLDKGACEQLQAEKATLVGLRIDQVFARGPDWAKANLVPSDLDLVKRYIDLDEQLKFRCGLSVVTLQVPEEPEDGPDDEASAPAGGGSVPGAKPKRKDAAVAKPAGKAVSAPAKAQPADAPVKPAPKPGAKPQSSWNTQTGPVEAASPAAVEQIDPAPKHDRRRPVETGG